MVALFSFVIGVSLGSFANVCIYRMPLGISVVTPRSYCPVCERQLRWFELIPIVSYVFLKARCGGCKERIPVQYPLIETSSGFVAIYLVSRYGLVPDAVFAFFVFLVLLIVAVIDWRNFVIPNELVYAGLVLNGVMMALISPHYLLRASLSAIIAGGLMLLVRIGGNRIFKKDTMGIGDIKLAILIGFLIGVQDFLLATWSAAILGCLYWLFLRSLRRVPADVKLPFGSFLSMTSFAIYVFPLRLIG